jgi:hypothetical protein
MTFSGEAGVLFIYLSIPKRRIGWSSGGGGENPLGRVFIFWGAWVDMAPLQDPN